MKSPEGSPDRSKRRTAREALQVAITTAMLGMNPQAAADAAAVPLQKTAIQQGEKIPLPPRRERSIEYIVKHGGDLRKLGITRREEAVARQPQAITPVPMPKPKPDALRERAKTSAVHGMKTPARQELPFERIRELPFDEVIPPAGVIPPPSDTVEKREASLATRQEREGVPEARRPESKEFVRSRDVFLRKLTFSTRGYAGKRVEEEDYRRLKPFGLKVTPQTVAMEHLRLHAKLGRFSLEGSREDVQIGRFERSLRFKNITDAVENRYNLPPGLLLAMLIQESSGADVFPNGRDDGGIGLIHMQPAVAAQFGLSTHGNNRAMVDKEHGRTLRTLIAEKKGNVFALSQDDERFNRLLNVDAVGRMLAEHMGGDRIEGLGPLRTAFKRYTGKFNYGRYLNHVRNHMRSLNDGKFLRTVAERFDARNRSLVINGKRVGEAASPFAAYLKAFWQENERGFDLAGYRKLPRYKPEESDTGLRTYKKFFLGKE